MEIVNEVEEIVTNWMAIYGPAILSIVSSITTAVVIILKLAAAIKNAKKEFATNSEVNELTKDVKELKDHVVATDRENRELKALLKKEIEAKTKIKEN